MEPGDDPLSAPDMLLRALTDALDDSTTFFAVIDAAAPKYLHVNEAFVRAAGVDRDTLLRSSPEALRLPGMDCAPGTMAKRFGEALAAHPGAIVHELESQDPKTGARRTLACETRAFLSGNKWLIAMVGRDISAEVRTREDLECFRTAIDQSADSLTLIDVETFQWVEVSQGACRMTGYPKELYMELGPEKLCELIEVHGLRERYRRILAKPEPIEHGEGTFRRSDGSTAHVEITRQGLKVGGRWLMLACFHDVTERKAFAAELEQHVRELQRSNEELERFAYVTSHDLTEPLRMIEGYLNLLRRRYDHLLDDTGREFVAYAVHGATRMKKLIDDLLEYSRAGRRAHPLEEVDLGSVVEDVSRLLGRRISDKGALVQYSALPSVVTDRTSLTQLMQNLLGNALKFVPAERRPTVRVGCVDDGDAWHVTVGDNGIGIEPQYFERVFEIFQRLHGRDDYEGSGIGLAICKKIVEHHGGRIWVDSVAGSGTTFHFTLPKVEAAPPGIAAARQARR